MTEEDIMKKIREIAGQRESDDEQEYDDEITDQDFIEEQDFFIPPSSGGGIAPILEQDTSAFQDTPIENLEETAGNTPTVANPEDNISYSPTTSGNYSGGGDTYGTSQSEKYDNAENSRDLFFNDRVLDTRGISSSISQQPQIAGTQGNMQSSQTDTESFQREQREALEREREQRSLPFAKRKIRRRL